MGFSYIDDIHAPVEQDKRLQDNSTAPSILPAMHAETPSPVPTDEGIDRRALRQIRQRFLQVNAERLARARSTLDTRQQALLDLLPMLFHSNHPMLPGYASRNAPCGLTDFNPGKADIARAQRLARSFTWQRDPHLRRQIHALYLMGSSGTIAQSDQSDLDIWVCHDSGLDEDARQLLRQKCDGISQWAAGLGLEAHFFLMEPERFRRGERDGVTSEDCGSSQHYLLLDEFYRTGLLLAGAPPIWWLIPPELESQHDQIAARLRDRRYIRQGETIDFGGLATIPAGEFLGAGAWQLYKAIDSPYKSVIKLLLTEVYASEYPQVELLGTRFKRAVYSGETEIDELDPYVLMYRKLERYLLARGESVRLELVRRCFYFKVGKAISRGPAGRSKSWRRLLLERLVAEWGWSQAQLAGLDARSQWRVGRVLEEQRELVRELIYSYRLLLDFGRRSQAAALLESRDMTVLGRKLYAAFERRAGKVEWVNPGIAPRLAEAELTFATIAGGRPGERVWAVYAAGPAELAGRQPLRRARDLIALLVWCHVNGLCQPDTRLHASGEGHQVGALELARVAGALRDGLPPYRTEASSDEARFLSPSRPQLLQFFVNIGIDPMAAARTRGVERLSSHTDSLGYSGLRENLVLGMDLVLLNSWGEVTTRSYRGPFALIQCLRDYLQQLPATHHPAPPRLEVHCFCPTRAHAIAARVRELLEDISTCYRGDAGSTTRYLLEMQREFYMVQFEGGAPTVQRAPTLPSLLEMLGRVQRSFSPIVLDRHCLQGTALAAIAAASRPERIQVFFQRQQESAEIHVVDELGSLCCFTTPFRDEHTLLAPLDQFIQSTLFRQRSERADFTGGTHDVLLAGQSQREIDYFELIAEGGRVRAERRRLQGSSSLFFNVQAIADQDAGSGLSFTIYCDQQEFAELTLGEALYDTVARHILAHRRHQERYPCYLTDIDLSRCIGDGGPIQTVHYLRYKQRLEKALNDALARIG
jgi:adenylate cyclase class 1